MFAIKLINLAKKINAKLHGDGKKYIFGIASIKSATNGHITFLSNNIYRKKLIKCKASAIILKKEDIPWCKTSALIVKNPYLSYAHIAQFFRLKKIKYKKNSTYISKNALIDNNVTIGKNVIIGANAIIKSGVHLNNNVKIGDSCIIGKNSYIDIGTYIKPKVAIYDEVKIGKYCVIHSGTVVGSEGFGYANNNGNWINIPHFGRVIIGNRVEIGANTTIDRGSLDNTEIHDGVIIDNQCHIAHNVIIGKNTAIAGGVIIAGGVSIGDYCMIGGASVINGHIKICNKVTITGMGMVMKSITNPGIYSSGIPIQSNKIWRKNTVLMMKINKIEKRLKDIERNIN